MRHLNDFRALSDHGWTVREFGDWLLIEDAETFWWCPLSIVTPELVERLEAMEAEGLDWLTDLCEQVEVLKDKWVDADALSDAREELGLDDDEEVARGW